MRQSCDGFVLSTRIVVHDFGFHLMTYSLFLFALPCLAMTFPSSDATLPFFHFFFGLEIMVRIHVGSCLSTVMDVVLSWMEEYHNLC